jgi:hypothetical protein
MSRPQKAILEGTWEFPDPTRKMNQEWRAPIARYSAMSVVGTKRTSGDVRLESAFKAEVTFRGGEVSF